jgi:hypothetical protein
MPFSLPQPLGAMITNYQQFDERLRSLEQNRILPGGFSGGASATFTTSDGAQHSPPGWAYSFTVGPTGFVVAFVQVSVEWQGSVSTGTGLTGLALDGGAALILSQVPTSITTPGFAPGFTVYSGLTPDTIHTLQVVVQESNVSNSYIWSDPFVVAWPI